MSINFSIIIYTSKAKDSIVATINPPIVMVMISPVSILSPLAPAVGSLKVIMEKRETQIIIR